MQVLRAHLISPSRRVLTRHAEINSKIFNPQAWNYQRREKNERDSSSNSDKSTFVLASVGFFATIKSSLGFGNSDDKGKPDKFSGDSVVNAIRQSMIHRDSGDLEKAYRVLHETLMEWHESADKTVPGRDQVMTRLLSEMGGIQLERGLLGEAEGIYKSILYRLLAIQKISGEDAQVVGVSLKLADIYSRRGELETAELGFDHCLQIQIKKTNEIMKNLARPSEATEDQQDVLLMQALVYEAYARFLLFSSAPIIENPQSGWFSRKSSSPPKNSRLDRSLTYIREADKIYSDIYGEFDSKTLSCLNDYGVRAIHSRHFKIAEQISSEVLKRVPKSDTLAELVPAYQSTHAEALFHQGNQREAIVLTERALEEAKKRPERHDVVQHCEEVLAGMKAEVKNT